MEAMQSLFRCKVYNCQASYCGFNESIFLKFPWKYPEHDEAFVIKDYVTYAQDQQNEYRYGLFLDGDPSNIQSSLEEIASWSLQNNAEDSDASKLEKLEKLLSDALRNTKSKKMLAQQNSGASTSASGKNTNGPRGQEGGRT
ncbi:uncharacterized protein LOC119279892 [Triticum dicoccoides]|uniref:uncharacterized protein LOC119279892 n=1 Tax=Triticum dicoccoides TaxID=85692 RepID=UPI00188F3C35|nr:uncharacterized protein LOC119279892 [Triticum dicoccoides]